MGELSGQVAIVTGGSRGIGRAIAVALAEHGPTIILVGRDRAMLDESVALVNAAVGLKAGIYVQYVSTFFAGIIIGFIKGWRLTLVMLAVVPLLVLSGALSSKAAALAQSKQEVVDAHASAIMAELFGAIRTVAAFTGEARAVASYQDVARLATEAGGLAHLLDKARFGFVMFSMFGMYSLVLVRPPLRLRAGNRRAPQLTRARRVASPVVRHAAHQECSVHWGQRHHRLLRRPHRGLRHRPGAAQPGGLHARAGGRLQDILAH